MKNRSYSAEICDAYAVFDTNNRINYSKIGCVLALILVPAGMTLDYVIYSSLAVEFLAVRLLCDVAVLGIFFLHYARSANRTIRILTLAWLIIVQIAICYMIYRTDGFRSTYYAGLNLAILGMGILLPVTLPELIILCGVTLILYITAGIAHNIDIHSQFYLAYNNLFFMILTGVISATAVLFGARRRFSEFALNFELGRKNKDLEELDRLKSNFFANVSHELRTPLTLILAPIEDLLQGRERLSDRLAGALGIVRGNALRLLKLVNDLLDVIRLEEGKTDLTRQPLRINKLLGGVVDAMVHLADVRNVALQRRISTEAWNVLGDQHALEKVFFNLLSNALKFTPSGGSVTVSSVQEGGFVLVAIQDTGIGISEEDQPFIFDRFRQVDSSSTRLYPGTGLGLALVKELTEAQGGGVRVSSLPGTGTTMTVKLPLSHDHAPKLVAGSRTSDKPDPLERIFLAAEQTATLPLDPSVIDDSELISKEGRTTVVVVDDEPDMRRYLSDTLAPDYLVLQAADGKRGLDLVRERTPDLMVLDLMLPELDGLEVCRLIKQDAATRATKVVLLTARADEGAKLTALEHGADDFLTKPFSSVELKTRLRNLLQTAMLERDLQSRNQTLEETLAELRRTEAQLVQSEKLNALGSLAAGLLHEINNPLNYAMTALQVAAADPTIREDDDLREIFTDIDEGMQRIRNIVSDLRAFAYPSADDHRPFSFGEAVASALQFTAHELRGVRIEQLLDETMPVVGSRNHIVQILVNLLSNAAKAVMRAEGEGERDAEIRITSSHADGERLRVVVRDNGVGIGPDALSRIFDPFYTTRDVGEGMGLGLSICHTIAKNHGGVLSARSQVGEWTEFSFDLPLAREG